MAAEAQISDVAKADAEARRWKKELQLSDRREKEWRDYSEKVLKRYRGEERKKNRWNVLWSNTSTLRPFIYNTRANPDVRRRFRDNDPVGKAVSMVLERGLVIVLDDYSSECAIRNDVLDGLICGRGVSRVRYVPSIQSVTGDGSKPAGTPEEPAESDPLTATTGVPTSADLDDDDASDESVDEDELEYERAEIDHVDWRDFRHGYGRVWAEVPWTGFRHKLTRGDATEKFGAEAIKRVEFTVPTTDDPKKPGDEVGETQRVAEFWEIWDKAGERVFFLHDQVDELLFPVDNPDGEPPINFPGFFPCPQPLYLVEDTSSLLPIPLFQLYEQQADELDKLSRRIDKIVDQLRLRGVYDAKLSELGGVMTADDNELVPIQNASAWREGGLDKAISWMPVEQAVAVLQALYAARVQTKAIIDEIMGIADIMRGATDPEETFGAQQLKQTNGNTRLQFMRSEVQRYIRDLLRLCAQCMAEKFSQQTFAQMTELNFPTQAQKQQLGMQAQQVIAHSKATGQPPPPPPDMSIMQMPTWEDILGLMRNNVLRTFRVDVETDSTVAASLDADMEGMSQVLGAVTQTMQGLAPLVANGAIPYEAAKELVMSVIRRARMGSAVEDAFDKLHQPQPQPPPQDPSIQTAQIKAQSDQQIAQMRAQAEAQNTALEHQVIAQTEAAKVQLETQKTQAQLSMQMQLEDARKQHEAALKQMQIDAEQRAQAMALETQRMIADADNQTKLQIAAMTQQHQQTMAAQQQQHEANMAQINAALAPKPVEAGEGGEKAPAAADYKPIENDLIPLVAQMAFSLGKPKKVIRDGDGKIVGVE